MGPGPNGTGASRYRILRTVEDSLRRLKTDRIDLYQIHMQDIDTPEEETLRALDDLVRAGKVRYLGASTFAAWQLLESLWVSKEYGLNRFVCEQPPYNLLDRRIERELLPMAQSYGIGIIPWSPLAGGLLTGKYNHGIPAGSRLAVRFDGRRLVGHRASAEGGLAWIVPCQNRRKSGRKLVLSASCPLPWLDSERVNKYSGECFPTDHPRGLATRARTAGVGRRGRPTPPPAPRPARA